MANSPKDISGIQSDIFRQLQTPVEQSDYSGAVDLDITHELRGAVATALKLAERRGMTRQRLVDELNRLMPYLNTKITLRKINSWMAASKEDHPIPAYAVPAICVATQCDLPMRAMANSINYEISDQREVLAQELGQLEIDRAATARDIQRLKNRLKS